MNNKNYNYGKYSEFERTKRIYEAATPDVRYPLTYEEWLELPDELKPSALYVTFYKPIIATVIKMNMWQVSEPDIISKIMLRFMDLTEYIETNPVAYKSTTICQWVKQAIIEENRDGNRTRSKLKPEMISNIYIEDDVEIDMFDNTPSDTENDPLIKKALDETRELLIQLIASKDADLLRAIMLILTDKQQNGKKKKIPVDFRRKYPSVLAELRKMFAKQASYYYDIHLDCDTFQDVINNEDLINSATVLLKDGTEAVYYGEKDIKGNHSIRYTFLTKQGIHYEYFTKAIELKVIDVEPKN